MSINSKIVSRLSVLSELAGLPPMEAEAFDPAPSFNFRGNIRDSILDRSGEYLLAGPAGTGKTLANLRKVHLICCKYAGCRVLIARKTRASMTESVMVTLERDILGPNHPVLNPTNLRRVRQSYRYANGSEIVIGGMDKPDKVLSSEYDCVYVPEATELSQDDWETLTGRLRNGRVPYQQMIADCNPTTPQHWLYKRYQAGTLKLYPTTHKDNPRYYDADKGEWTEQGQQYLERLSRLTGPRRARFLLGEWRAAEGCVYEHWDESIHMVDHFPIPLEWPRYLSIDFGFRNPFVCIWGATDPDGRLYIYREIYQTGLLIEDAAKAICRFSGAWDDKANRHRWGGTSEPKPRAVTCDHDAEGRATLERHSGLGTIPAMKKVLDGIQETSERLRVQEDGKPRLFIMRDARVNRADPELEASGKPTCGKDEIPGYIYDPDAGPKEKPVKEDDHFCFVAGTLIETIHGDKPIEDIVAGDLVRTHLGFSRVIGTGETAERKVFSITTASGKRIECTGEHPISLTGEGWIAASESLGYWIDIADPEWKSSHSKPEAESLRRKSIGEAIGGIDTQTTEPTAISAEPCESAANSRTNGFTRKFGRVLTAKSRKGITSTMSTKTRRTILRKICGRFCREIMRCFTLITSEKPVSRPWIGTAQKRDANGTVSTPERFTSSESQQSCDASTAERNTRQPIQARADFAISTASQRLGESPESMTLTGNASVAADHSASTVTATRNFARKNVASDRVVGVVALTRLATVYALATEDGTYFANGILVSNCDALRYLCAHLGVKRVLTIR